jgi:hypothetical protein
MAEVTSRFFLDTTCPYCQGPVTLAKMDRPATVQPFLDDRMGALVEALFSQHSISAVDVFAAECPSCRAYISLASLPSSKRATVFQALDSL